MMTHYQTTHHLRQHAASFVASAVDFDRRVSAQALLFALCCVCAGLAACGGQPAANNQVADASQDAPQDAQASDASDASPEEDMTQRDAPEPRVLMTLTPVEWGLGPAPVDASATRQVELERVGQGSQYTAQLVWPAGVWQLSVVYKGQRWGIGAQDLTGLGRSRQPLELWEALVRPAPMLSVVDEPVQVRLDMQLRQVDITRTVDAPDEVRLDAPDAAQAGVGAAMDQALEALGTGQGDEAAASALSARVHALGGGPVASSMGQFFFSHERTGTAPEVRGTMTQWEASAQGVMRPVKGQLWGRFMDVPQGPQAYKLVYGQGASWRTDPSNRHVQWDGIARDGVGDFNSLIGQPQPATSGRTLWWPDVRAQALGNARPVYVHLPPGYDASPEALYPTLYVQDGNESITRGQFHDVADAWSVETGSPGAVLVFVALAAQEDRFNEYTMASQGALGDAYADFLATTLVPRVERHVRARPDARARGVIGASLGGLISFWSALRHPTVFEYVGGMSSSFFWAQDFMIREVQARGCQGLRYYIDSGEPRDNADVTRRMRDVLTQMGCVFEHVEQPGGQHEWSFWKARFANALRMFYQGSLDAP